MYNICLHRLRHPSELLLIPFSAALLCNNFATLAQEIFQLPQVKFPSNCTHQTKDIVINNSFNNCVYATLTFFNSQIALKRGRLITCSDREESLKMKKTFFLALVQATCVRPIFDLHICIIQYAFINTHNNISISPCMYFML